MNTDVDHLIAALARDPGPGLTPGARDLLGEITDEPSFVAAREPRRRWWRVALPVVTALVTAVVGVLAYSAPASAALDIRREGPNYVIMVVDIYADPDKYQNQLRAIGLDIRLRVKAAPASLVGQVIMMPMAGGRIPIAKAEIDDRIKAIGQKGTCRKWGDVCPIGLKIPVDYRGRTEVTLGRAAKPGERYDVMAPIDGPGEPLHCVPYVGRPVRSVRDLLRERGVTSLTYATAKSRESRVPGDWYVHDGTLTASDAALLLVGPDRTPPRDAGPKMTGDFC
ncbi:hypothetical protein DP939_01225 [Spongiactinospora rosea]|uniref:Uncharacterized protein n=1 Tax=Spongiactinospora rosea TaxID=2248750 RepID=A0A366M747_9ACTN|nr:hypothetical protein [Spongiactinospora rosea]RBQ21369.1 hypothetical protein DP939_01225 [Spongiactinospora rosea]